VNAKDNVGETPWDYILKFNEPAQSELINLIRKHSPQAIFKRAAKNIKGQDYL
jgi:hypothetical protein